MYYHLIDGDWASNACSWQWVAGANSNKKYYANQENINKYCYTNQRDTFLDKTYEMLEAMAPPAELMDTEILPLLLGLPETSVTFINPELPTFIYNYYNLDPLWANNESGNRILLIEPDFFKKYPVSKKCMDFMLELSQNIKDIQIYTGSFQSFIERYKADNIYFKEHPLNIGYVGNQVGRDWITEEVIGYYPSFFAYWKQVSKKLNLKYSDN
jgi:deoxyribodipyrimidine photo-lyase